MGEPANSDGSGGLHILIVGAGIGGLSAALSIRSSTNRHRVTVLEATPSLTEVSSNCLANHLQTGGSSICLC